MVSLAGSQHWTVSAFPTYMSILHIQPAIVSILELIGSHEIDMSSRGHIEGSCWVNTDFSFFLRDVTLFAKGVILMKTGQSVTWQLG